MRRFILCFRVLRLVRVGASHVYDIITSDFLISPSFCTTQEWHWVFLLQLLRLLDTPFKVQIGAKCSSNLTHVSWIFKATSLPTTPKEMARNKVKGHMGGTMVLKNPKKSPAPSMLAYLSSARCSVCRKFSRKFQQVISLLKFRAAVLFCLDFLKLQRLDLEMNHHFGHLWDW